MSQAEHRRLDASDFPEITKHWSFVFNADPRFFSSLTNTNENISFGTWVDGGWVASVHTYTRWIRGLDGEPQKVGGLANVSTHPDYRGKGHSGELLKLTLAAMEDEGMVWSYLGTGVNDHYARYGWRTFSTPHWTGERPPVESDLKPLAKSNALLEQMAGLYDSFSDGRPLAHVRTLAEWMDPLEFRLSKPEMSIYGSYEGDHFAAYLVVQSGGENGEFIDAACLPGHEDRFAELFAAAIAGFPEAVVRLRYKLPTVGGLWSAFQSAVPNAWPGEIRGMMARPIADRISWADLGALLADSRGRHSPLDNF